MKFFYRNTLCKLGYETHIVTPDGIDRNVTRWVRSYPPIASIYVLHPDGTKTFASAELAEQARQRNYDLDELIFSALFDFPVVMLDKMYTHYDAILTGIEILPADFKESDRLFQQPYIITKEQAQALLDGKVVLLDMNSTPISLYLGDWDTDIVTP